MYNKRKHFGQHMLSDQGILQYEVDMLSPDGKVVLEIGGGTGNLSRPLSERAKHLIIIEKDFSFVQELQDMFFEHKNVTVIEGDFLETNQKEILQKSKQKKIDVIISNVPYSISSPLLFKLREFDFEKAVLCLQKEFVDRMVAKPGDREWSRLSVMTDYYFKPIYLKKVGRGAFKPVPQVDSAIVMLFKKNREIDKERDLFVERLFTHRKNTLHAASKADEIVKNYPNIQEAIAETGLGKRRIFTLSNDEIDKVYELIRQKNRK
jgi:16S rRNA (adenine1518-N6/adenine1519-N6)-dimethyltransferase